MFRDSMVNITNTQHSWKDAVIMPGLLDQATFSDKAIREQIIHQLAQHPSNALPVMIDVLTSGEKVHWAVAAETIRAIGYPANSCAIPVLLDHLSDGNSPAWHQACQALLDIEVPILGAVLVEALLDRGQYHRYWPELIRGIASLFDRNAPYKLALLCGPTIVYLLSQPHLFAQEAKEDQEIYTSALFSILKRLGPPCGIYAMPCLLDLAVDERLEEDDRDAVWKLIAECDEEVKKLYAHNIEHIAEHVKRIS
jgi:HEAT repeat protein